jgi:hypothetical protein
MHPESVNSFFTRIQAMKFVSMGISVSGGLILAGLTLGRTGIPIQAQTVSQSSTPAQAQNRPSPEELRAIREAPFSKVFTVNNASAVKDQDYKPSDNKISVQSLWADLPDQNRFLAVFKYCVPNLDIAGAGTSLAAVILSQNGQELVKIDQVEQAEPARNSQVRAATGTYQPFYDSYFWNPFGYGYIAPTYFPAVDCSSGGATFNLMPVQAALAQLPNQTLDMQLLFENGMTSDWKLGGGTVEALKQLPILSGES